VAVAEKLTPKHQELLCLCHQSWVGEPLKEPNQTVTMGQDPPNTYVIKLDLPRVFGLAELDIDQSTSEPSQNLLVVGILDFLCQPYPISVISSQ
jgi:hypothetical protein